MTVPALASVLPLIRRTGQDTWTGQGIRPGDRVLDTALRILAELAANCVSHAAGVSPELTVIYARSPGVLTLGVHDDHPHRPRLHPGTCPPGTGLGLVTRLVAGHRGSASVVPDPESPGKTVWVFLPPRHPRPAKGTGPLMPYEVTRIIDGRPEGPPARADAATITGLLTDADRHGHHLRIRPAPRTGAHLPPAAPEDTNTAP